jgi:hypothetical protein
MTTTELIAARHHTHGDFEDNSKVSQAIKAAIRNSGAKLTVVQREALDYIAGKIGRICSGNANETDHWQDIAGYCMLALKSRPSTVIQVHNPARLESPGEGYRFMFEGEKRKPGMERYDSVTERWFLCGLTDTSPLTHHITYRIPLCPPPTTD